MLVLFSSSSSLELNGVLYDDHDDDAKTTVEILLFFLKEVVELTRFPAF